MIQMLSLEECREQLFKIAVVHRGGIFINNKAHQREKVRSQLCKFFCIPSDLPPRPSSSKVGHLFSCFPFPESRTSFVLWCLTDLEPSI